MTQVDPAMVEPETPSRGRVPTWVAVAVVVLVTVVASGLVYKFVWKTSNPDVIELGGGGQGWVRANPLTPQQSAGPSWGMGEYREGLSKTPAGVYIFRRFQTYLRYDPKASGDAAIRVDYLSAVRRLWLTREQSDLSALGYRVAAVTALAEYAKVSDEQRQKLREINQPIALTAAEQSTLKGLLQTWDKTTGPDKQSGAAKVLDAVGQIGTAHLAETRAAAIAGVQSITSILTPQQIQLAKQWMAGGSASQPTK